MILFKKIHQDAVTPTRGSQYSAGLDLSSVENLTIPPGKSATINTGLSFQIDANQVGLIWPRSKLGAKKQIQVLAGVIDSDYRGGVMIALLNSGSKEFEVFKGDKIAQLIVQEYSSCEPCEVGKLNDTSRGSSGINSTEMRIK